MILVIYLYFLNYIHDSKALLSLISIILSAIYFIQKQKLEEEKFLFESFSKYNERFAIISDDMQSLPRKNTLDPKHKSIIARYFDLCAEEYYLYKHGRLNKEIWKCWASGAFFYIKNYEGVRLYWQEMEKHNLNYGLTIKRLEKIVESNN